LSRSALAQALIPINLPGHSLIDARVAVCLLPGTELAFERDVRYNRNWLSTKSAGFRVDTPHQHHDAVSFPDGNTVIVNLLSEGQYARVLQLPVVRREQDVSGEAEKAELLPTSGSSLASAEHGEYRIRRGHKHARVWRSWSVSPH